MKPILAFVVFLGLPATAAEQSLYDSLTVYHAEKSSSTQEGWGDALLERESRLNGESRRLARLGDDLDHPLPIHPIPGGEKHILASLFSGPTFQRDWSESHDIEVSTFDPVADIPLDVLLGFQPRDSLITMEGMPGVGDVSVRTSYSYPNDDHWTFLQEVFRSKTLRQSLPTDSYELSTGITSSSAGSFGWSRTRTPSQAAAELEEAETEFLGMSTID